MQNLINKLVPSFQGKLLFVLAILLGGIGFGWHLHTVWDNLWEVSTYKEQLAKAQAVPGKIDKFHQKAKALHVQDDPCYNTNLPTGAAKLLR